MMQRINLVVAAAVLALVPLTSRATHPDYATGVTYSNANPSPTAQDSNINDYTFQDERLNLAPTDGNVRVLRTDQKVMLNNFVSAIIPLEHASPRELRGPIRTVVRKEGGEADVLQDFVNKKNYLQVTCPDWQLPYVKSAIKALDQDWVKERLDGSEELYFPMRFRDVDKVLNITRFYVSPEFNFHVDKVNNALYYRDEPPLMGLQRKGLQDVDIPPNQMMMDVAIYEVTATNNLLVGNDFVSWKNGPGRRLFEAAFGYAHQVIDEDVPGGNFHTTNEDGPFLYGSYNALLTSAYVDFLCTKGKAKLLNRAQITAKSGSTGTVSAVEDLLTFNSSVAPPPTPPRQVVLDPNTGQPLVGENRGPYAQPLPSYRDRSLDYAKSGTVGVNVQILPVVGQKSSEVAVSVDVSDVTGFTPSGTPIIKSRSVNSKIRMYPGEPYVLAGLTRKSTVSSVAKVPILGSIPVLGWLFGHETESKGESQVIIVMTPSVSLNAESIIAMPADAKTAVSIVNAENQLPAVPENTYGFDQWLLDKTN